MSPVPQPSSSSSSAAAEERVNEAQPDTESVKRMGDAVDVG